MAKDARMWVRAARAAWLLDMSRAEFLALVEAGALPRPNRLGRWEVAALDAAMRGEPIAIVPERLQV